MAVNGFIGDANKGLDGFNDRLSVLRCSAQGCRTRCPFRKFEPVSRSEDVIPRTRVSVPATFTRIPAFAGMTHPPKVVLMAVYLRIQTSSLVSPCAALLCVSGSGGLWCRCKRRQDACAPGMQAADTAR